MNDKADKQNKPLKDLVIDSDWIRTPRNAIRLGNLKSVSVDEGYEYIFEAVDGWRRIALYLILILLFIASPVSIAYLHENFALAIFVGILTPLLGLALLVSFRFLPRYCRTLEIRTKGGMIDRSVWRRGRRKEGKRDELEEAAEILRARIK
ncbi:hypothetical protein CKO15_00805 [Halorhodospira abdelmalekii]|uniref:hypothetical protein n=1 Tax=Halorhodospira abdelmalekii TaxID=421629 RepID=UPI001907F11B|nr:hypothetical protein [Halorhodospira abdelmalekii]MBK1733841.1 hypothetical protein [Halorhodospira abdelmalekii]